MSKEFGVSELKVKSFVSESDIEEEKRKRQEEWERVRKPDQPLMRPEAPIDNRCLYDRLKEQKDRKQEEYEEERKFKNQFRGLDNEETEFLSMVSQRKMEIMDEKVLEELELIKELKDSKKVQPAKDPVDLISKSIKPSTSKTNLPTPLSSQSQLLAGAVKRKKPSEDNLIVKKQKNDNVEQKENSSLSVSTNQSLTLNNVKNDNGSENDSNNSHQNNTTNSHKNCDKVPYNSPENNTHSSSDKITVVGYLPGMVEYSSSDDSDDSSSSSESEIESSLILKKVTYKDAEKCVRTGHHH